MCRSCNMRVWWLNRRMVEKKCYDTFHGNDQVARLTPAQHRALRSIERVPYLRKQQGVGEMAAAIDAQQQFDRVEFAHPPMPTADEQSEVFEWAELPEEQGLPG